MILRYDYFLPAFQCLPYVALPLLCLFLEPRCESPYKPNGRIDAQQFMLPWDGPGAAVFNPAMIADTK